jgi:hypothetical protein
LGERPENAAGLVMIDTDDASHMFGIGGHRSSDSVFDGAVPAPPISEVGGVSKDQPE